MKKSIALISALFIIILLLFLTKSTYAQYGQYGAAGPSFQILINKMVGKPTVAKGGNIEFVENLTPSDPRFTPSQDILFQIKVKNVSNTKLANVVVKDFIPSILEPVEGPGSFDKTTRIVIINAGDFAVDEEKIYTLKMQVVAQDRLPSDKSLICEVNKATASNDNVSDEDTSQFCVEKQVLGLVRIPSAGPGMGFALFSFELIALSAGLFLKRIKIT